MGIEPEILVTRSQYDEELKLVAQLEEKLASLQSEWLTRTGGLTVAPPEEYRREEREARRLERMLSSAWSDWARYMVLRRETLRRGETRRAARYLALIRETRRRVRDIQRRLGEARAELSRKILPTPELERIRSEIEETARRLERERSLLERKVVANKLIAMHKRWFYESPRGRHHDISIEAIASIVVDSDEPKEKYEDTLRRFLEDEMYRTPNFERLTELTEEVVGFEEKLVHPARHPVRGPELHTLEWWHRVFAKAQLLLEDFMPE